HRAGMATLAVAAAALAAGIGPSRGLVAPSPAGAASPQPPAPPAAADRDPADFVRALASRSADWLGPSPDLEALEYDFIGGTQVTPIRVSRGDRRRGSVWMGATLHAGVHSLLRSPDRF